MFQILNTYKQSLADTPSYIGNIRCSLSKQILQQQFYKWLFNSKILVEDIIQQVKKGTYNINKQTLFIRSPNPLFSHHKIPSHKSTDNQSLDISKSQFSVTVTPPRIPSIQINQKENKKFNQTSIISPSLVKSMYHQKNQIKKDSIPQFYFTKGKPITKQLEIQNNVMINNQTMINKCFEKGDIGLKDIKKLVVDVFELPCYLSVMFLHKAKKTLKDKISKNELLNTWKEIENFDFKKRSFHLIKKKELSFIEFDDFQPILSDILDQHSGLQFLRQTPQFQQRYANTVISRIFYRLNRKDDGKITYRQFKRSNFLEVLKSLEFETDTNRIKDFFSYEDFYVIYCKFWELDPDHDFFINKQEFSKYNAYALSRKTVDRIFSKIPRRFKDDPEKMSYTDFICKIYQSGFILNEEDKTTPQSIEYWFKVIDLDNNGIITGFELQYFFEQQNQRLHFLNKQTVLSFENIVCEMSDLLKPERDIIFTLEHFKSQMKECGLFFNILTNLNKLVSYQQRDPHQIRSELMEHPDYTDWNRFVKVEYRRLQNEVQNAQQLQNSENDQQENHYIE